METETPANERRDDDARREDDLAHREGRFQRWLALIAGFSSVLSGLEVTYEHYKGSYGNSVMYAPPLLSAALLGAGVAGFVSKRAATTVLPAISYITLVDCAIGFGFHVRGIQRKPGGWGLPVTNVVMGPPLFAPLLFGISAYLGVVASRFRRADDEEGFPKLPRPAHPGHWAHAFLNDFEAIGEEQDARETAIRRHLAIAAALSAFLSAFEALYSHYKNNFRYSVQWTPIVVAPILMAAGAGAAVDARVAHRALPAASALALLNGTVGFGYHVRGVLRRPGGMKKPLYNVVYGPPIFAPLLFGASGLLGLLASVLGRSR